GQRLEVVPFGGGLVVLLPCQDGQCVERAALESGRARRSRDGHGLLEVKSGGRQVAAAHREDLGERQTPHRGADVVTALEARRKAVLEQRQRFVVASLRLPQRRQVVGDVSQQALAAVARDAFR